MKKLLLILCCLPLLMVAQTEKRLALVIGNANYDLGVLKNPVNDALLMEKTLKDVGFEVMLYTDLVDRKSMNEAVREFGKKVADYQTCLVYYAGHGIQINTQNYLIPTQANLRDEYDVDEFCLPVDKILSYLNAKDKDNANLNIVILDACRNNPFERKWSRTVEGKGLAKMENPAGTLIAYSTDQGTTADDNSKANNSLYCSTLSEIIKIPNLTIEAVFKEVMIKVLDQSGNVQNPTFTSKFSGEFIFKKEVDLSSTNIRSLLKSATKLYQRNDIGDWDKANKKAKQVVYQLEDDATDKYINEYIEALFIHAIMEDWESDDNVYYQSQQLKKIREISRNKVELFDHYSKATIRYFTEYLRNIDEFAKRDYKSEDYYYQMIMDSLGVLLNDNVNYYGEPTFREIPIKYIIGAAAAKLEKYEDATDYYFSAADACDGIVDGQSELINNYTDIVNVIYNIYRYTAGFLRDVVWDYDLSKQEDIKYATKASEYMEKAINEAEKEDESDKSDAYDAASVVNGDLFFHLTSEHNIYPKDKDVSIFNEREKKYGNLALNTHISSLDTINILHSDEEKLFYKSDVLGALSDVIRLHRNLSEFNIDSVSFHYQEAMKVINKYQKDNDRYLYLAHHKLRTRATFLPLYGICQTISIEDSLRKQEITNDFIVEGIEEFKACISSQQNNFYDDSTEDYLNIFYEQAKYFYRYNDDDTDSLIKVKRLKLELIYNEYLKNHPKILSFYPDLGYSYTNLALAAESHMDNSLDYNRKGLTHFISNYKSWLNEDFREKYSEISSSLISYNDDLDFSNKYEFRGWVFNEIERYITNQGIYIKNSSLVGEDRLAEYYSLHKIVEEYINNDNYLKNGDKEYWRTGFLTLGEDWIKIMFNEYQYVINTWGNYTNTDGSLSSEAQKILDLLDRMDKYNTNAIKGVIDEDDISSSKMWTSYIQSKRAELYTDYLEEYKVAIAEIIKYRETVIVAYPNDAEMLYHANLEIANTYKELQQKQEAIKYYNICVKSKQLQIDSIRLQSNSDEDLWSVIEEKAQLLSHLGEITLKDENINKSIDAFQDALVELDNKRLHYISEETTAEGRVSINNWYERQKESLYYNIADQYYIMHDYVNAIENYKSALFYVDKDDYQRKTSLYEELLLQYSMIDDVEEAKIIYSKVPESLENLLGKQLASSTSIDTLKIGSILIPMFNIEITTSGAAKPLLMFDCNANQSIDPAIDKIYYANTENKLDVVYYSELLTEDLFFNGTVKFNYFQDINKLDVGVSSISVTTESNNNTKTWTFKIPLSDIVQEDNNVHYIVNIVQPNPLNRIFPIDGVHYKSKYRIDSYPTNCRYDGFNGAYKLEY
jgi:hypothetical protein